MRGARALSVTVEKTGDAEKARSGALRILEEYCVANGLVATWPILTQYAKGSCTVLMFVPSGCSLRRTTEVEVATMPPFAVAAVAFPHGADRKALKSNILGVLLPAYDAMPWCATAAYGFDQTEYWVMVTPSRGPRYPGVVAPTNTPSMRKMV